MPVPKRHDDKCCFLHVCEFVLPWSPSCTGQAARRFLRALITARVTEEGVMETSPAAVRWAVKENHAKPKAPHLQGDVQLAGLRPPAGLHLAPPALSGGRCVIPILLMRKWRLREAKNSTASLSWECPGRGYL